MDIKKFVQDWLSASNAYDTERYLKMWHPDAILNDPSVGRVFKGHTGIRQYFEVYFIGYKTKTRLIRLTIINGNAAHLEVEFSGEFPEGKIGGLFEFTFKDGKIAMAKADLT